MDVIGTFAPAWQRTKRVLMQPFDAGTWFSFGVIFFVQSLLEGSETYTFRLPGSGGRSGSSASPVDLKKGLDAVRTWMTANASLVITLAVVAVVFAIAMGLVLTWLGARGQMMAIRSVMTGRAAIGEHWSETRTAGWSLFKAHIVIGVIAFVFWGPLVFLAIYRFVDFVDAGMTDPTVLAIGFTPLVVVGALIVLVLALVHAVLRNCLAPIMLHLDLSAGEAWSHFVGVARGNVGRIALFFLIRFVLASAAAIAALVVVTCTCCLGGLPVLHQAILAPWLFFERAYGLYVIESLDPDMQMLDEPVTDYR